MEPLYQWKLLRQSYPPRHQSDKWFSTRAHTLKPKCTNIILLVYMYVTDIFTTIQWISWWHGPLSHIQLHQSGGIFLKLTSQVGASYGWEPGHRKVQMICGLFFTMQLQWTPAGLTLVIISLVCASLASFRCQRPSGIGFTTVSKAWVTWNYTMTLLYCTQQVNKTNHLWPDLTWQECVLGSQLPNCVCTGKSLDPCFGA